MTFMTALLNTLMGMGTVFAVLIFISLIISLFVYIPAVEQKIQYFFNGLKKGKNDSAPKEVAETLQEETEQSEEEEELIDDAQLVAVIMAAIAASSDGAVSADKLIVRSVRRVSTRR